MKEKFSTAVVPLMIVVCTAVTMILSSAKRIEGTCPAPAGADPENFRQQTVEAGRSFHAELTTEILPGEGKLKIHAKIYIEKSDLIDGDLFIFLNKGFQINTICDENGREIDFSRNEDRISIGSPMAEGEENTSLVLEYEGCPESFMGTADVSREGAYASWLTFWYPSVPNISGLFGRNRFIVPKGLVVASNGTLVAHIEAGETEEYVFDVETPVYYSFSAGKYYHTSRRVDGIEFRTYFLSGGKEKADYYVDKTAPVISFYRELFGIYPYENFNIVEIPEPDRYKGGGFSEQGLIFLPGPSLPDSYFNFPVIAHEMGHLWWGNWVIGGEFVMSEGLAQLSYLLCAEHVYNEDIMRKYMNYGSQDHFISAYLYLAQSSRSDRKESTLDTSDFARDHHVVMTAKGSKVFLMLRDIVGRDAFEEGLRNSVTMYAHTRMPLAQLFEEWEKTSGLELDWFYDQWVKRAGVPELELTWTAGTLDAKHIVDGRIVQKNSPPYRLSLEIGIETVNGMTLHVIEAAEESTTFRIALDSKPQDVVLDPGNRVLFRHAEDKARTLFAEAVEIVSSRTNYETAVSKLEELLIRSPNDIVARAWLGIYSYRFLEDYDRAFENLGYVVDHADPLGEYEIYYSRSCFLLGELYDLSGEREKAVEHYRKTLELDRTGRFDPLTRKYMGKRFEKIDQ